MVSPQVIAAVQRVITGKGSIVALAGVSQIRIFKYDDATGGPLTGAINVWTPGTGPIVDGVALKFVGDYHKSVAKYPNVKTGEEFEGYEHPSS